MKAAATLPVPRLMPAWLARWRGTRTATIVGAMLVLIVVVGVVFAPLFTAADPLELGPDRLVDPSWSISSAPMILAATPSPGCCTVAAPRW